MAEFLRKNLYFYMLALVKEAIEKANGIISHKMNGSYFTVTVMLPMETSVGLE